MSLTIRWDGSSAQSKADCKKLAEDRAGPSENGYLYRLYWSRDKSCIRLIAYPILKITPKCWKIHPKVLKKPVYVSKDSDRFQYACEDLEDALLSYRHRRSALVRRLEFRLRDAQRSLDEASSDRLKELYWLQDEEVTPADEPEEEELV